MGLLRTHGIGGCAKDFYYGASGRWAANFMLGVIYFSEFRSFTVLALFSIFNLSAFIFVSHLLFSALDRKFSLGFSRMNVFALAWTFTMFLFFLAPGTGEIWFWTNSAPQYLWSVMLGLLIASLILKEKRGPADHVLLALSSLYIGGASESFAAVYLLAGVMGFFFANVKVKQRVLLAMLLMLTGFSINLLAPGNAVRASWLPEKSLGTGMEMTAKAVYHLFADGWMTSLASVVCFLPVFILFGIEMKSRTSVNTRSLWKIFFTLTFFSLVSLFLPSYFVSDVAPKRACELAYLLIAFFILTCGVFMGMKYGLSKAVLKYSSAAAILLLIGAKAFTQAPIVMKYTEAADARIEQLKNTNTDKEPLELSPLPSSGMLYSAEITADTTHWTNRHLKFGLGLKFHVVKKP